MHVSQAAGTVKFLAFGADNLLVQSKRLTGGESVDLFRLSIVAAVGIANVGLAVAVYVRNSRSPAHRTFAAAAVMIVCWLTLAFLSDQADFRAHALWLNRLTASSSLLMAALLLYFVIVFPRPERRLAVFWKAFLLAGIALTGLTTLTPLTVAAIESRPGGTDMLPGPFMNVVAAWLAIGLACVIFLLFRKHHLLEGRPRAQLRFVLLGIILFGATSLVLGLLVPMATQSYELAYLNQFATLFIVGLTAYAMIKHRLMDMHLVVLRSIGYGALTMAAGAILVMLATLARANLAADIGLDSDAVFAISGLAAALAFQPVRRALERTTDRIFYRRTYDPDRLLSELGGAMASTLDPAVLAEHLARKLTDRVRLSYVTVAYEWNDALETAGTNPDVTGPDVERLLALNDGREMILADDPDADPEIAAALTECGARMLVPLVSDSTLVGAILLGAKQSGSMLSEQDVRLLEILAPEAAIAMKNARLFEEKNQRVRELTALNGLARALGMDIELDTVLENALREVVEVTGADTGSIMLLDEQRSALTIACAHGIPEDIVASTRIAVGQGIAGWVARSRAPLILVQDTDPRFKSELLRDEISSAICVPVIAKDAVIGVLSLNRRNSPEIFSSENLHVVTSFAGQLGAAIENARLYENLEDTFLGAIGALAAAVDAKDPYTYGHSNEVTIHAVAIAEKIGLGSKDIDTIRIAATLHDIGKIGIDSGVLCKASGLTPEECEQIHRHPAIGAGILAPLSLLKEVVPMVLLHHERYEGGGYPSGVSRESIPIGARIITVADSFNAMVSDRPYRKALSLERAIEELRTNSGTQFDPIVVDAFLAILAEKDRALTSPARTRASNRGTSNARSAGVTAGAPAGPGERFPATVAS